MNIFGNIFNGTLTIGNFTIAVLASAILAVILAFAYMIKNTYTKSVITALILIPVIESVVIMMVNDNLGLGLSVAGSFALIRFRSVKGNAKELAAVFAAMTLGVICGSGYIFLAAIFTLLVSAITGLLSISNFGQMKSSRKYLKITTPESLNYDEAFDEILKKYCTSYELKQIKTLNMGSLFRVDYDINLKDSSNIKKMIDKLRTRNGNLEILCGTPENNREEL